MAAADRRPAAGCSGEAVGAFCPNHVLLCHHGGVFLNIFFLERGGEEEEREKEKTKTKS